MPRLRVVLEIFAVAALAAGLAAALKALAAKREVAIATVDDIESQLDALDPVTRAAVVARLSKEAADQVQGVR